MTKRVPKVGWANDVVYWYSQLLAGKEVPSDMRPRVEELRQHLSAKGAARFLCAAAGGGEKCLVPLPEKRTPVPKGIASKATAQMLPALTTILEVLQARQTRKQRAQEKVKKREARAQERQARTSKVAAKKQKREATAAAAAAESAAAKPAAKASKTPKKAPAPSLQAAMERTRPTAATKKSRGASTAAAPGALDLDALINSYAEQIDPAELAASVGSGRQKKAA